MLVELTDISNWQFARIHTKANLREPLKIPRPYAAKQAPARIATREDVQRAFAMRQQKGGVTSPSQ